VLIWFSQRKRFDEFVIAYDSVSLNSNRLAKSSKRSMLRIGVPPTHRWRTTW
jgi:hypothetical protein